MVDANRNPAVASVTWSSSDNTMATVDGKGLVSPVKERSATISASVGNSAKTYIVQILPQDKTDLESITVINRNQLLLTFNRKLQKESAER